MIGVTIYIPKKTDHVSCIPKKTEKRRRILNRETGFSLIEILISLMVLAIISSVVASLLSYSFKTKTRIKEHSQFLSELQLTMALIKMDTLQIRPRTIRDDKMHSRPAFIGSAHYLELSHLGTAAPILPNSTNQGQFNQIKRVAYICREKKLIRRSWQILDAPHPPHKDQILLHELHQCHFAYLSSKLELLTKWRSNAVQHGKGLIASFDQLPKAIQFNFGWQGRGKFSFLALIPGNSYGKELTAR